MEVGPTALVLVNGILEVQWLLGTICQTLEVWDHPFHKESCLGWTNQYCCTLRIWLYLVNQKWPAYIEDMIWKMYSLKSMPCLLMSYQWVTCSGSICKLARPFFDITSCWIESPTKAFTSYHIMVDELPHAKELDCCCQFLLDCLVHAGMKLHHGLCFSLANAEGPANTCFRFPVLHGDMKAGEWDQV